MVRTRARAEPPARLSANAKRWTVRYQANLSKGKGDWATRGAKKMISLALQELTHGKCVYCEGPLGPQADLDIDHYISKTLNPERAFEWTNLLPSCRKCNRPKGNHDHANALLKPDSEDPEPFFWLHPDSGRLEPHPSLDAGARHRAEETIRLCDLQRSALCEQRYKMFQRVNRWLLLMVAGTSPVEILSQEWDALSDPRQEYKFVLRHALGMKGLKTLADKDRQRFHG